MQARLPPRAPLFLPSTRARAEQAGGGQQNGYNQKGNVISRTGPDIPGGSQTIIYTPFDLPEQIHSLNDTTEFEYTADEARLVRRTERAGVTETIHFAGDLFRRVSTVGASFGTIEDQFRFYVGDREIAELTRSSTGSSNTRYFHADHQGSVDVISTEDGLSYEQRYDVFGAPLASGLVVRSGYTGHQHDRDLGFIDMRGRMYDPLAARFVSADPITQEPAWSQGLNRYAYVFNDPVNYADPSGFFAGGLVGAIVGAGHLASGVAIAAGFGASLGAIANFGASVAAGSGGSLMPGGPSFTGTPGSGPRAVGMPQMPQMDTSQWLAQNAGDPDTGVMGAPGSGSSEPPNVDDAEVLSDMAAVAPLPGPGKVRLGVRFWQWVKRITGLGKGLARKGLAYELKHFNKHLAGTAASNRLIQKEGAAHVFKDKKTLEQVENAIFDRGKFTGVVRGAERYGVHFKDPI